MGEVQFAEGRCLWAAEVSHNAHARLDRRILRFDYTTYLIGVISMRSKVRHSLLGMSLVAATIAAPSATTQAAAQGSWGGFSTASVQSALNNGGVNTSPAFTAAVTTDAGGTGSDLWVSNHAERSEILVDWQANTANLATFANAFPATGGFDSHGAAFSDVDGDGDDDLIETSGRNHNTRLFKNSGGSLAATSAGGLEDFDGRGRTVLMVDIDTDGDMDALIVNLDRTLVPDPNGVGAKPSELYLNNGTGTAWTKVADPNQVIDDGSLRYAHLTSTGPATPQVILTSNSFVFGMDTVRTNVAGLIADPNPVNTSVGINDNATNMRDIALGDLDGDLDPEWVVARQDDFLQTDGVDADGDGNFTGPNDTAPDGTPDLLGQLPIGIGNISKSSLVSNDVVDITNDALADNCRAVSLADFDNDGDLDIFGGCAMLENNQTRNIVLLNDGTGNFTIAASTLVPATGANTATVVVNADFNDDGWIDTYVGGGYDSQPGEDYIFLNNGGSNGFLKVNLVDASNPDVMGAQVFVGTNTWQVRESGHRVHRGQDMKELHFGLGTQTAVAPVEVMWPDGTFTRCDVAGINQTVTIDKNDNTGACETQTQSGLLAALAGTPDMTPVQSVTPPPPVLMCNNLVVTVDMANGEVPTAGADVIRGTSGNDTINGLGGNDTICSLAGDDTINAGDGFDKVFAGGGNDTINGGAGNDLLIGGAGIDTINGGNGNDRIQGGDGADMLNGDGGPDRINGGNGNDIIRGGTHPDELFGNLGRDQLFGDGGDDVLRGGAWKDIMNGGTQTDGCTLTDPGGLTETRISCETGVFGL